MDDMYEVVNNISMWLNDFVKENNIDLKDMAQKLDCSTVYLENFLKYKDNPIGLRQYIYPRISFLGKLCDVYKVKIQEVVSYGSNKEVKLSDEEKLVKLVNIFKEKYIGTELNVEMIKNEISTFMTIEEVREYPNFVIFEIHDLIFGDNNIKTDIREFRILVENKKIKYLVLEQSTYSNMVNSIKQRYYYDKENFLFVSSIKMEEVLMLMNLCIETTIKYNQETVYIDRHEDKQEAIDFNDKILSEVVGGKTIEEIKELYNNF